MQDVNRVDAWIAEADDVKKISAAKAADRAIKKIMRLIEDLGWDYQSVADDANRATGTTEWTPEIIEAAYKAKKKKQAERNKNLGTESKRPKSKQQESADIPATLSVPPESTKLSSETSTISRYRKLTETDVDLKRGKTGIVYLKTGITLPKIGETIMMPSGTTYIVRKIVNDRDLFGDVCGYEISVEPVKS